MLALVRQFFEIAFFRAKPQDLPVGSTVLVVAITLAVMTYVLASVVESSYAVAMQRALLDLGITALFIYGGLLFQKATTRFQQAFSALAGSGAVINLVAVVLMLGHSPGEPASSLLTFMYLLLFGWSVALCAHIFKHTFDLERAGSTLVAIVYIIFAIQISQWVIPPTVE